MWKELLSNSGPLSRSYGLEMIGFPILYWGVLHDESSLCSKSTPIKKGLFIPLWDTQWMFAWNAQFHPLSFFMSDTVVFVGISIVCVCVCVLPCCVCGLVSVCAPPRTVGFIFASCLRIRGFFLIFTRPCMSVSMRGYVGMCVSAVVSLCVYRVASLCLCQ